MLIRVDPDEDIDDGVSNHQSRKTSMKVKKRVSPVELSDKTEVANNTWGEIKI